MATAIALADAGGLTAVSMRAVAAALDTGAGSLYRYLSSRDDLLDLMTDRAVGSCGRTRRRRATGWTRWCCWVGGSRRCSPPTRGCST
ncbi:helix-turn-helix domain-containing protein [Micromonospora sp. M12]